MALIHSLTSACVATEVTVRSTCRVCDGALSPVLSLGEHYVSDFPLPNENDGIAVPLDLVICDVCRLLQLRHTVPAGDLYRNYWYRSGTNQTMRNALADIAHKAELLMHLSPGDAVLDIGCNDGTLLKSYQDGVYRIGYDPAQNLAEESVKCADVVVQTFFDREAFASGLIGDRPRVVTSIAMFYDLEDPNQFVADVKAVMDPDGLWIVQMSYLPSMLRQNAFDNICHEHLEYYSLTSMQTLLYRHEMEIVDVELNDVNGGSIRLYIRNLSADFSGFADSVYCAQAVTRVEALRQQECQELSDPNVYADFALRVNRIKNDVAAFILSVKDRGRGVAVYGASTKGNTLLQYFNLDRSVIDYAVERNPEKWGRETVGTRIPIIAEAAARTKKPDYMLVLPWHFIEEFQVRERDYLRGGGRFIVPLPHFSLI